MLGGKLDFHWHRGNIFLLAVIALCTVSIIATFTTLLSADWYSMKVAFINPIDNVTESTDLNMGLWRVCVNSSCTPLLFHPMKHCDTSPPAISTKLWASRAMLILSAVFCFFSVIMAATSFTRSIGPSRPIILAVLVLIAGALQGVAIAVFVRNFNNDMFCGGDICTLFEKGEIFLFGLAKPLLGVCTSTSESWALYVACGATILTFVAMFLVVLFRMKRRRLATELQQTGENKEHQEVEQESEEDSPLEIENSPQNEDMEDPPQPNPTKNPYAVLVEEDHSSVPQRTVVAPQALQHTTAAPQQVTFKNQPQTHTPPPETALASQQNTLPLQQPHPHPQREPHPFKQEQHMAPSLSAAFGPLMQSQTIDDAPNDVTSLPNDPHSPASVHRIPSRGAPHQEENAAPFAEDDDVPEGDDWELDPKSNMFWSPSGGMFWDVNTKRFYDPQTFKWFNPKTGSWSDV